jgi:hypothetical protein
MAHHERYRGNAIQVEERDDDGEELRINDRAIEAVPDPAIPGMWRSRYAFSPAPTLLELGRLVVDAQLALTTPQLDAIQAEEEDR